MEVGICAEFRFDCGRASMFQRREEERHRGREMKDDGKVGKWSQISLTTAKRWRWMITDPWDCRNCGHKLMYGIDLIVGHARRVKTIP